LLFFRAECSLFSRGCKLIFPVAWKSAAMKNKSVPFFSVPFLRDSFLTCAGNRLTGCFPSVRPVSGEIDHPAMGRALKAREGGRIGPQSLMRNSAVAGRC
jgi:hypothetical protein